MILQGNEDLSLIYERWLRELFAEGPWSPVSNGGRIPWRLAVEAMSSVEPKTQFGMPGLYLFGRHEQPVYLGMTMGPLRNRLRRRYLVGPKSQCELAATYSSDLLAYGVDGFPADIRAWYARSFRGSTVRLRHAAEFAQLGIEDIWVAIVPVIDKSLVRSIEGQLIPIAAKWNLDRGFAPLLNHQQVRK